MTGDLPCSWHLSRSGGDGGARAPGQEPRSAQHAPPQQPPTEHSSSTAPPAPRGCPHRPASGLSSPEAAASVVGAGQPETPPAQPADTETTTHGMTGLSTDVVCSWPGGHRTLPRPILALLALAPHSPGGHSSARPGTHSQRRHEVQRPASGTRCNSPVH